MNYLAHLHLASLSGSSLLGNLLADFVRGDPYSHYSNDVADGIMLHRRVDKYVDTLPLIREAKQHFIGDHRRVSLIALDVLWDHFLALHWQQIENEHELAHFLQQAEQQIAPGLPCTPLSFQQVTSALWQERWLERYASLSFIANVLERMAKRRPKLSALATVFSDIERNYSDLESRFWLFYPQMIALAEQRKL